MSLRAAIYAVMPFGATVICSLSSTPRVGTDTFARTGLPTRACARHAPRRSSQLLQSSYDSFVYRRTLDALPSTGSRSRTRPNSNSRSVLAATAVGTARQQATVAGCVCDAASRGWTPGGLLGATESVLHPLKMRLITSSTSAGGRAQQFTVSSSGKKGERRQR